jgi:hypothetical protein
MKVFISGAISSDQNYIQKFSDAALWLVKQGYTVMNPAILPHGFEQNEYLHICKAMIDCCSVVAFLPDWVSSPGAKVEHAYAIEKHKEKLYIFRGFNEKSIDNIRDFYNG